MNRRDTLSPAALVYRLAVVASAAAVAAAATLLFSGGFGLEAQAPGPCDPPNGNPVVCENQKAGNLENEWDIDGAGDSTIQGFATDISYNRGGTVTFKIKTTASNYRLDIYRMGYYSGMGARKVATVNRTGTVQTQPNCLSDSATGLIDCGNWAVSTTWTVPADAVSGIYFAKLVRIDTGGASHIPFVVRDDASTSDLLFQTSDATWQAYNQYGGNSLYVGAPATNPNRAYKVSYNRPFTTRATSPEDWMFNAEYPMVRWLEANGYNVAYASSVDTDRGGAVRLKQHKTFLSVGHDEYWSAAQRTNVEAARAAGVHLAFFSGNEVFWKTRYENSTSTPATAYRTLVSYKETHANAKIDPQASIWTGSWEDPRFSPPADGNRPSNALTGTLFRVNSGTAAIKVPAADGKMRFWRNTSVGNQLANGVATLSDGTLGFEWDEDVQNAFRPAGLIRMSDTTVSGVERLQDYGSTYQTGTANHALTLYRYAPSGALVFGAGTVQWSWGLDSNHERGAGAASLDMQQATMNLFADMGVQPLTIQSGLFAAVKSTDLGAPTSTITSPAAGTLAANSTVTITGTAVDNGGGQVGGVEVSVDNGTTWKRAIGRGSWSYSWQTGAARTVTLKSRAADDSGNVETPSTGVTVTLGAVAATCPCSIWGSNQAPSGGADQEAASLELGTRFRSDVAGYITAIRFYRSFDDEGPHTGSLWTNTGTRLATVTFGAETDSGWQQATLANPVAISANTTYVVSYHTNFGYYYGEDGYFAATTVNNGPLHAPADGTYGANGVFRYGASAFPTDTYASENYWADVVFQTAIAADTTPPLVSSMTPANGAIGVALNTSVTATFNEAMTASTISAATVELRNSSNALVASTVTYSATTQTVTIQPTAALAYISTYTATVKGGSTGVKDAAGNALAGNSTWAFTTTSAPQPPPTSGPGGPILVISSTANPFSQYYAEILRAEGLNAFSVTDLTAITATVLNQYDVVILGEMPLSTTQVTMLSNWVTAGGNLIAMRPDKKLAALTGLTDVASTLGDAYLLVDTANAPGTGIVGQTMQFHGTADRYTLSGATPIATLYSTAAVATANPAITVRSVGTAGGQAAAFTYDLARSVVYTRQGNPAWASQERDGQLPRRSDDLFFGGTQADYVDLTKVAIPQADEQQRLLANLIGFMNTDRKPLPKFWYLPRGLKAAVVMTGDDHANNGTVGRFNIYNGDSAPGCSVADWECIRGTSYIFNNTPISAAQVAAFTAQGFEIGVHMWMSGEDAGSTSSSMDCHDFTTASVGADYSKQLALFNSQFPSAVPVRTNRTHCIVWSDYATQPQVALANGIRLDTNYYYWPDTWVNNVPGVFTGSGMAMRFAKTDGTMIDVYQAASQMTDESGQSFPLTVDTLLDRALGPEGYYGTFVANMHTDTAVHASSEAIVASAQARGVPVITAKQLLTWLDGRNGSSFGAFAWDGTTLGFTVSVATGANNLQALLPTNLGTKTLTGLTRAGVPVPYSIQTIKGVSYATFASTAGAYQASYVVDSTPPVVSGVTVTPGSASAVIAWTTNEAATSRVDYGVSASVLSQTATVAGLSTTHSIQLTGLAGSTTYYYRITSADAGGSSTMQPTPPSAATFATLAPANLNCPCSVWPASVAPVQPSVSDSNPVELGLKVRASVDGFITGIRFYKGSTNVGPHVGNLWSTAGALLGTVVFANETASGWQQATLATPVAVIANTTYVVSYHTASGFYAGDGGFFTSAGVTNGPLKALANGADGPNGVYKYGTSGLPTDTFNSANYWVDVVFDTSAVVDTTPPTVASMSPTDGATSVAATSAVSVTFSEDVNPTTVTAANIELRTAANVLVPATVTYAQATRTATLQPQGVLSTSATYTARVRGGSTGIKDIAGNALTVDATWVFTISGSPQFSVTDTTAAQFAAGTSGAATYVAETGDGEVILAPAAATEFSGTTLPTGWSITPWTESGSTALAGGRLGVDGSRVGLDALLGAGRSMEFTATFSADTFTHVGFGVDFAAAPWAMFSSADGAGIYARSNDGSSVTDTLIPGSWIGTPHRYRIDWTGSSIAYSIDGTPVATHVAAITTEMRPIISDYNNGGGILSVDWVRVTPYQTTGTFTSRVIDAGAPIAWNSATWSVVTPADTTLALSARFGNTPVPDGTWTPLQALTVSGAAIAQSSRYVQYQSVLGGSGDNTPSLQDIRFTGAAPTSSLSINDLSVNEGDAGSQSATFTISLAPAASTAVSVAYATANGTATAGSDYTAVSGTLTFPAGTASMTVAVPVAGDTTIEGNETFFLNLSSATNATIGDAQGVATIVNDDTAFLSIGNASVTEGNASPVTANFTVTMSSPSTQTVTVNYATATGTASAADFTAKSGTLTFAPGVVSQTIPVVTLGDTFDENDETFTVNLSNPVNAVIAVAQGTGTIVDNDATPSLSVNNVSVTEGNTGTVNLAFTVLLSAASGRIVTVDFATANGTATAPADYIATSGPLTFAAGTTTQSVLVPVVGDVLHENNETVLLNLSNAVNATISDSQGTGTIVDNDPLPTIAIGNVTVTEGNTGTVNAVFTVSLNTVPTQAITVNYATVSGTASSTTDYNPTSGTLTFAAGGPTSQQITVVVKGDTLKEANETFGVNLSNATNATISDSQGVGTIVDDDVAPSVVINNVSITEGNSGTKTMTFTLTLSAVSGQTASVNYATANNTAVGGSFSGDYTTENGTVTFNAGTTTGTVTITVRGDTTREADETFFVNLTNPQNLTIADNQGIGTILNDD